MGTTPLLSVRPATLGKVAPVIVDLIMVYDNDVEEIYTAVPVTNEEITEVLSTQVSQGPKSLDIGADPSAAEGDHTTPDQTPRPLKEKGSLGIEESFRR
jgi:hypothetical protein